MKIICFSNLLFVGGEKQEKDTLLISLAIGNEQFIYLYMGW